MSDYERKMNGKGYRFMKICGDLLVLNIEFILTVVFSLTFLFFPALFSLVDLLKKEKESYVNPFKDYFIGIKKYFRLGSQYWLIAFPIYALSAYLLYLDYQLIHDSAQSLMAWLALIIVIGFLLAMTSAFIELPIFLSYFEEKSAWMAYKKAALIARKKVLLLLTSWMIIIAFLLLFYVFYPFIFFFGIALMAYIIVGISRKVYETLEREEKKRKEEENEN